MFHRLDDADDLFNISIPFYYFSNVVSWSRKIGDIVSMNELILQDKKKVRISITFDDGFRSFMHIKEIIPSIPSTLYVSTAFIETDQKFWVVELEELVFNSKKDIIDLTHFFLNIYDISTLEGKKETIKLLNLQIKDLHPRDIEEVINYLKLTLCYGVSFKEEFLSWREIEMLAYDGVEIGGHTHSHIITTKVMPEEFREELITSNSLINKYTSKQAVHFAYPNGRKQDISNFSREILKAEGYISAVTTIEGANSIGDDPFMLKRFNVSKDRIKNPWGRPSKAMFTTMLVNPIDSH
jgi:peptidoglycan/xylan/chitin deacetylase (PgdA/CDA1 family)